MKVCVDENIPAMTVQALRVAGHDVLDVRGTAGEGMSDAQLWATTQAERRLLVTTDKGFSQHRDEPHAGILIVRLRQPNRQRIHERALQAFPAEVWPGSLVVMRDSVQSVWPPR